MALALLLGSLTLQEEAVRLYRQSAARAGHDPDALPISINAHGYVGRTSQEARDVMYPYFAKGMMDNNHQRGWGMLLPRPAFDAQTSPGAGLLTGSPHSAAQPRVCGRIEISLRDVTNLLKTRAAGTGTSSDTTPPRLPGGSLTGGRLPCQGRTAGTSGSRGRGEGHALPGM